MLEIHKRQLARFGGAPGIRDEGGIDAALARPHQLIAYGGGLAMLLLTLRSNGWSLDITNDQAIHMTLKVADGTMSEDELVQYCRENSVSLAD